MTRREKYRKREMRIETEGRERIEKERIDGYEEERREEC